MDLFWKLINEITEYIPSRINPVSNRGYFNKIESYKNNRIKQLEQYAEETKKNLSKKDLEIIDKIFKEDIDFLN